VPSRLGKSKESGLSADLLVSRLAAREDEDSAVLIRRLNQDGEKVVNTNYNFKKAARLVLVLVLKFLPYKVGP
jgi:hypothetical protein